jgi:hypothetical protein
VKRRRVILKLLALDIETALLAGPLTRTDLDLIARRYRATGRHWRDAIRLLQDKGVGIVLESDGLRRTTLDHDLIVAADIEAIRLRHYPERVRKARMLKGIALTTGNPEAERTFENHQIEVINLGHRIGKSPVEVLADLELAS